MVLQSSGRPIICAAWRICSSRSEKSWLMACSRGRVDAGSFFEAFYTIRYIIFLNINSSYRFAWRHLSHSKPVEIAELSQKTDGARKLHSWKKVGHGPRHPGSSCQGPATSKFRFQALSRNQAHQQPRRTALHPTSSTPSAPLNPSIALAHTAAMAENNPQPVASISRTTRPMSEALLNEKVQFPK